MLPALLAHQAVKNLPGIFRPRPGIIGLIQNEYVQVKTREMFRAIFVSKVTIFLLATTNTKSVETKSHTSGVSIKEII